MLVAGAVAFGVAKWRNLKRAQFVANMFSGADQIDNFGNMDANTRATRQPLITPGKTPRRVSASSKPSPSSTP
jgi:hypothetical protein